MRLARKIRLGSAVVVSLIIGVTLVTQASAAAPPPPGPRAPGHPTPPSRAWLDNQHLGVPAIHPHAVRGSAAAFTASDVIQWVNAHGTCCDARRGSSQVVSVDFITAAAASQRLGGEWIGRPDASLVCFVRVHGDFMAWGPIQSVAKHAIYHDAVLIFDAQTGGYLLIG